MSTSNHNSVHQARSTDIHLSAAIIATARLAFQGTEPLPDGKLAFLFADPARHLPKILSEYHSGKLLVCPLAFVTAWKQLRKFVSEARSLAGVSR